MRLSVVKELKALHHYIYVSECYNVHDLVKYAAIWEELVRRGYDVSDEYILRIRRARRTKRGSKD